MSVSLLNNAHNISTAEQWAQEPRRGLSLQERIQNIAWNIFSTIVFPIGCMRLLASALVHPMPIIQHGPLVCFYRYITPNWMHPSPGYEPAPIDGAESMHFHSRDGVQLSGHIVRSDEQESKPPREQRWIIFHNPNAAISSDLAPSGVYTEMSKSGQCNVMAFDYRGTGASHGMAQAAKDLVYDSEGAVEYLLDQGVARENIVLHGYSLGGGIAAHTAANYPGVHLLSDRSFRSIGHVTDTMFGTTPTHFDSPLARVRKSALSAIVTGILRLVGWNIDAESQLPRIRGNVRVLYGRGDTIINANYSSLARAPYARDRALIRELARGADHDTDLFQAYGPISYKWSIRALCNETNSARSRLRFRNGHISSESTAHALDNNTNSPRTRRRFRRRFARAPQ